MLLPFKPSKCILICSDLCYESSSLFENGHELFLRAPLLDECVKAGYPGRVAITTEERPGVLRVVQPDHCVPEAHCLVDGAQAGLQQVAMSKLRRELMYL